MDAWRILGLQSGASSDEVRRAYLRLAKDLHPDVNPAPGAVEMMRLVNLAYEELRSGSYTYTAPPRRYPDPAPRYPDPAPRYSPPEPDDPCDWVLPFGKHKGKTLLNTWKEDPEYINWCVNNFDDRGPRRLMLKMLKHQQGGVWDR